ncbi:MAG TPA: cytochrome C oxidase subunit IV family protein [bacterium]|nr:cytochrome C oxidase subunit IV family protein [bacterium]
MENHSNPHYGRIFLALFALTVAEVLYANLHLPRHLIIVGLVFLAVVKASLVALFYMHLKFEKALLAVIGFAPLLFSIILTMMVGADIRLIHP